MGGLFSDPGKAAAKANTANAKQIQAIFEKLYGPITGMYDQNILQSQKAAGLIDQGVEKALAYQGGQGNAAKLGIAKSGKKAMAMGQQDLIDRGASGTVLSADMRRATAGSTADAYAGVNEALAQMQGQTIMQGAGMKANAASGVGNAFLNKAGGIQNWGGAQAGALGQIQHTGGQSTFSQLLGLGGQLGTAAILASDRRLKENTVCVGKSPSGIPVWEFNYTGRKERYRGVMADQVEHVAGAVSEVGGYKHVDYSKLDVPFERIG